MFFLLGLVSILGQEAEQLGVIRAGQYVAAIQGIFPDGVGEGRSGPVWGQLFEDAPLSQKQMILAEIIDRVEVRRGYQVTIKFKLTARQFLEPDADAAGDQKAS